VIQKKIYYGQKDDVFRCACVYQCFPKYILKKNELHGPFISKKNKKICIFIKNMRQFNMLILKLKLILWSI